MRTTNFEYNQQIDITLFPSGDNKIPATRHFVNMLQCEIDEIEQELYKQVDRTIYDLRLKLAKELLPRDTRIKWGMERLTPEYGVYLDGRDDG